MPQSLYFSAFIFHQMANTIFINIKELAGILPKEKLFLRGSELNYIHSIKNAWLKIEDGIIDSFGQMADFTTEMIGHAEVLDVEGRSIIPAFVDSHTHLVHAGTREDEWILRLQGKTYAEIAASGGGILNSAAKLQKASEEDLLETAVAKLNQAIAMGTGAIEIKSGYGLAHDAELKMLRVIQQIKKHTKATIKSTFLALHALPSEYKNKPDSFVDQMIEHTLPMVAEEGLADYVDAFCEEGYFTTQQTLRLIEAAAKYGIKAKIHVNQFVSTGAVKDFVSAGALSLDHLEVMTEQDLECFENSKTIATLLPACSLFIDIPYAPAGKLIEKNAIIALASDYNPGSSPTANMQLVQSLACIQMKLSPSQALNASTINGAAALDLGNTLGSITPGKKANLIITNKIPSLGFMSYNFGHNHVWKTVLSGHLK